MRFEGQKNPGRPSSDLRKTESGAQQERLFRTHDLPPGKILVSLIAKKTCLATSYTLLTVNVNQILCH